MTLFADMGGECNNFVGGVVYAAVYQFWYGKQAAPTPSISPCGWTDIFFDISECFPRVRLYVCLTWVHPMTPMDTEYTYVWEAPGDFGRLSHGSGVGPWGGVHLCYLGKICGRAISRFTSH